MIVYMVIKMTEKRFEVVMNEFDEVEYITDKVAMEDKDFAEFIEFVEDVCNENEQLKKAAKEFTQNKTQHNLWRLRTVLKDCGVE